MTHGHFLQILYYFIPDISQANKVTTNISAEFLMPDNALNLMVLFLAPIEGK